MALKAVGYKVDEEDNPYFPVCVDRIEALTRMPPVISARPGHKTKTRTGPPAWQGVGQREYVWWFADAEQRLTKETGKARAMLDRAANNWRELKKTKFVPTRAENDGRWIEPWTKALDGFGAWREPS
jgi:hypothetical protein